MAEYIEREAVNDLIKAECSPKVAAYLIDAVATVPAADVRPVVRGKWNAVKGALHPAETSSVCSNCGFATMIHAQTFYNFCSDCGADMREES